MSDQRICQQCREPIPEAAPAGACPHCLLKLAVSLEATVLCSPHSFQPPSIEHLRTQFDGLKLLALVGRGGMGAVYRARQTQLDRIVALKILPPERARDPQFTERFLREARALAKLSHPHIVGVYDAGQSHEFLYIVMEYVDGANLRELIRDGRLSPAEAMRFVPQICDAMQYAHEHGVIHRDIKPENVLVDQQGQVKIADFGLAKLSQDPEASSLTVTGMRMGTVKYMAPEQSANAATADHRADIYSLGLMFYEMLTGKLPSADYTPPSRVTDVDVRVDRVIERTIKESPDERYQQAIEVKQDVERIASSRPRRLTVPLISAGVLITGAIAWTTWGPSLNPRDQRTVEGVSASTPSRPAESEQPSAARDRELSFDRGSFVIVESLKLDRFTPHTLEAFVTPLEIDRARNMHVLGTSGQASLFINKGQSRWTFSLTHMGAYQFVNALPAAVPGVRVHLAAVRTGSQMRLYLDGKLAGSVAEHASPMQAAVLPFSLSINERPVSFSGRIDEVRVSRIARYDQDFTPPTAPFQPDDDTLALFHCDEGSGDVLKDSSGHEHAGRVVGAKWIEVPAPRATPASDRRPPSDQSSSSTPPLALAPFGATEAQAHQQAWAAHLGSKIEITNKIGMKLRLIPPGEFRMGTPQQEAERLAAQAPTELLRGWAKAEAAEHAVRMNRPFYVGSCEVTVEEFQKFIDATDHRTEAETLGGGWAKNDKDRNPKWNWRNPSCLQANDHPVVQVSWNDAQEFCRWLSQLEKTTYHLPTEAQWEYACRAGTTTSWSHGSDAIRLDQFAWHNKNSKERTSPTGKKRANPFGLFDLHGNVEEWCSDASNYGIAYPAAATEDPVGATAGSVRLLRGGHFDDGPNWVRSARRSGAPAGYCSYRIGFRVVCEAPRK